MDGKPLFEFKRGEVQLYHDDHQPGPAYSFDWSVSALATIVPRPDNTKLTAFKEWVERVFIVSLHISHHPELIDYLGPECGKWIERDPLGPTRVKAMPEQIDEGLKLSEQVARGWTE